MITIPIPYGRGELPLHIEEAELAGILSPAHGGEAPDLQAQRSAVQSALENPVQGARLCELAKGKRRVLVITSDHTRPVPSKITLPLLLAEIRAGNPGAQIVILIATGMHRATTPEEIIDKFGAQLATSEHFENHICTDEANMVDKGTLPSGGRLRLNRRVDWADLIVSEGFIEPHFFAGFSGGRKAVLPGIASEEAVRYNHNSRFIGDSHSRQGVLDQNPIHRDMRFAAEAVNLAFILNVVIDGEKRIVGAVAGSEAAAHAAGCRMCLERARVRGIECDIAITSNGGYPLDQNIYQAVKGMTAAESCVRRGGVIIIAAECADGHGGEVFFRMLAESKDAGELYQSILAVGERDTPPDQWQVQILARVLMRAHVIFVTAAKNRGLIEGMHMEFAASLGEALASAKRRLGGSPRIAVIPDGVGVIVE